MAGLLSWFPLLLRRRTRDKGLALAATWPTLTASLLGSKVVAKDALAGEGTAFQTSQIECAFYFTLDGTYFGGHLRSTPLSDSEAHRMLRSLAEDTPVVIRYKADDPDQTHTLASDNLGFPMSIWSS